MGGDSNDISAPTRQKPMALEPLSQLGRREMLPTLCDR